MTKAQAKTVREVTWVGLLTNILLTVAKFTGGIVGRSQAVVADAVHSLSDCSTDLAILIGVGYWSKPADADHPHGHRRLEMAVTVFIGIVLLGAAVGLAIRAVMSLRNHEGSTPGWIAFAVALISIISKEALYRWTQREGRRVHSSALQANAWHHRSDALSSIPAAIAVLGTALRPGWDFLDHLGAIVVSGLILQAGWKILGPPMAKLLDRGAPASDLDRIREIAEQTPGVESTHGLRTRYTGPVGLQVDLHIQVSGALTVREGHEISEVVKQRLLDSGPDVTDVIVHLEPE